MKRLVTISLTALLFTSSAFACTGIKARMAQGILVAANEDYNRTFQDIVTRIHPGSEDRYGYIGTGFQRHDYFMMGLNDRGLFLDMFTVPEHYSYERDPNKQDCNVFLEGQLLEECATVEEAIAFLEAYNHPSMATWPYQLFVVDASGESAVINYGDGDYEVVRSQDDCQVVTNFYLLHPEFGYHPCWRYDTASQMMTEAELYSFRLLRDILDSVHLQSNFSQISNLSTGDVFVFNNHNYDEFVQINLYQALAGGYQEFFMPDYFSQIEIVAPSEGGVVSSGNVVCEWRGHSGSTYRLVYSTNPDLSESSTIDIAASGKSSGGSNTVLLCGCILVVFFPFRPVQKFLKRWILPVMLLALLVSCSQDVVDIPVGDRVMIFNATIESVSSGETVYWKIEADTGNGLTSESVVCSFTCGD